MLDANIGWAQISNSSISAFGVLYTTDGGAHWQDVTPTALKPVYNDNRGLLYPLDANTAWITDVFPLQAQPVNAHNVLFRTTDAGKTWQKMTLPSSTMSAYASHLIFLNSKLGFFVSVGTAEQEATKPPEDLWQTNNGGQTWNKVNVSLSNISQLDSSSGQVTAKSNGNLSPTSPLENITFITEKTWWLTGFFSNGSPILYVTQDAGLTWQKHILPVFTQNSGNSSSQIITSEKLQFFSANDGILTLSSSQTIYITHDGGVTWSLTAPIPSSSSDYQARESTFIDINHGWIYEEVIPIAGKKLPTTNRLIITSDGGQHWTTVDVQMPGGQKGQSVSLGNYSSGPDFVSDKVGWLIGDYTPSTSATDLPHTDLFQTLDGGLTWHVVNYSISQG
jgi:photosystem II stability/assembly factor-like uncharacterized protein